MATSELACTYAALILHDDGLEITADNLNTILKAANVTVEPYWPALYVKLFAKKSIGDLISNVGAAGPAAAAAPAAGGAAAAAPAAKKEEKKEESEEEDMGFSLFD
jgi:ribosomal protein L12E/L44/L45/RPP1/RPP2